MPIPTFVNLAPSDRVDHDTKVVYTSPKPGVPPVYTGYWTPDDWAKWEDMTARVHALGEEAEAAGYRVVAV